VADDILLESTPEPFVEIRARDLRNETPPPAPPEPPPAQPEPEPDQDTSELPAVDPEPAGQARLEGVTASADWSWDEPEDYSAPV
jgi:hypothetical protein